MRRRLTAAGLAAVVLVGLTACFPDLTTLQPVGQDSSEPGTAPSGAATQVPQPQVTGAPGTGGASPDELAPGGTLLNQVNYKDLTIYVYSVGTLTTTAPSIYARPDGSDPYPAGTTVEATAYVLANNSQRRLDLTDLSADYSAYGNDLAQQDVFAGQDLLTDAGYSTSLESAFPADTATWYLLPGESAVFANAWFHRPADGPLTLQFLWPAERIFLGANIQF
ncbi:hypothetical protein [Frigoribacterium sp. PvP032]|uniref:hypothetical protein n=1 Tax=Frigoribacterium sp. PvP032 TaxID=2806589 RepID=UPI001AE8437E|nr:hypothetical protein [Frigoribacterium sp. PvP032]MBP1190638.1 hypothetical protein [Frigoribacterium sp. PvP032]